MGHISSIVAIKGPFVSRVCYRLSVELRMMLHTGFRGVLRTECRGTLCAEARYVQNAGFRGALCKECRVQECAVYSIQGLEVHYAQCVTRTPPAGLVFDMWYRSSVTKR